MPPPENAHLQADPAARGVREAPPLRRSQGAVLAALLYLGVALWTVRVILPAPASTFPYPATLKGSGWLEIALNDQELTAALTTHHARTLVTRPWRLFDNGQCYPTPNATTLGEPMFGVGVLGVVPSLVTGDPILTYNLVLVLKVWLAGLAMYALVYYWTASVPAALVAGLVFAAHPMRLGDLIHPYICGNEWTPLALLYADRLFARARWRDAAGLTTFVGLQTIESFYPLLALVILGGTYGVYLLIRHARSLRSLAPKLLPCGVLAAALAAMVVGPYLRTKATWDVLGGRTTLLYQMADFGFGGPAYAGSVALALGALALVDRLRRARRTRGPDPRLVLLTGGLLVVSASVYRVPLPFTAVSLPSLYTLAAGVVPGLDSVRAGAAIGRGTLVAVALLAGYGVLVLVEALRPRARALVTVAIAATVLAEVFMPAAAQRSFGTSLTMRAHWVRPPDALLALYQQTPEGPVLDLPFTFDANGITRFMPHYVFLGAFHHRPVGACYNSFTVAIQTDIEMLASRMPDAAAAEALAALGFRTVVVHEELLGQRQRARQLTDSFTSTPEFDAGALHLAKLGTASLHTAYRIDSGGPVVADLTALAEPAPAAGTLEAAPPEARLSFAFRNRAAATYRHPSPLEPTPLLVRWAGAGAPAVEYRIRVLLPLVLAPRETTVRSLEVPVPAAAGEYEVTLAPAATPDLVLGRRRVRVRAPGPAAGAPG